MLLGGLYGEIGGVLRMKDRISILHNLHDFDVGCAFFLSPDAGFCRGFDARPTDSAWQGVSDEQRTA